ncbi:unnamed protein product [Cylindrotheca closterium]|uniref:Uncharacterized protein n=1 Tax=Cylindrotheca closterium TaxID=2856 RepID=A0AAD2JGV6_9STRA|nr:unnamed protein product [Cylindrotheca closterium]
MMPLPDPTEQEMLERTQTRINSPQHDAERCTIPSSCIVDTFCETKVRLSPRKSCLASKSSKKKKRISMGTMQQECTTSHHVFFRQTSRWKASEATTDSVPRVPRRPTPQQPSSDSDNIDEAIANFVSNLRIEEGMSRNSLVSQAA